MTRTPLQRTFALLIALLAIASLDLSAPPAAAVSVDKSAKTKCLTISEVNCLLSPQNCTDNSYEQVGHDEATQRILLLGRVRLPKTASTLEARLISRYEEGMSDESLLMDEGRTSLENHAGRFLGLADKAGCAPPTGSSTDRLCFTLDGGGSSSDDEDKDVISLAFSPMQRSKGLMGHVSYDTVASRMEKEIASLEEGGNTKVEGILLTGLRDPASYAASWYGTRSTSDMIVDLSDLTFSEWIERVPWRMNVLTRVLGSSSDRKAMPEQLLYFGAKAHESLGDTDKVVFMKDAYMAEQNELGPDESPVYQLALERLRNDFVHFTILHRLPDSWRLLAHRFCWDMEEQEFNSEKADRGVDALLHNRFLKDMQRPEAEQIWARLQQKNRLDIALMKEADRIMDERIAQMEAEKADGVLCNFLGRVKVTCGVDATSSEL